jgi:hypothetical protein
MNDRPTVEDLNALYSAIASLREATALLEDQIRGTNDSKYELCKDYRRVLGAADRAYNNVRKLQ